MSTKLVVSDETRLELFSDLLVNEGTLRYTPAGDRIFGLRGFAPRHVTYRRDGEAVPRQPPGFILLAAGEKALTPGKSVLLLNPLLGTACVLIMYAIGRSLLGGCRDALLGAAFLGTTPVLVQRSQMFFLDIANATAFLSTLLFALWARDTGRYRDYLALGLSAGVMAWMRQSSLVLAAPFVLLLLLDRREYRARGLWISFIMFSGMILLPLIYDARLYGGPFEPGYSLAGAAREPGGGVSSLREAIRMLAPNLEVFGRRMEWLVPAFTLAFPPMVLAAYGVLSGFRRGAGNRTIAIFCFVTFVALFCLTAGIPNTYGFSRSELTLQSFWLR